MPAIKIGKKTCEFEEKKTILQVALENDIEIPHCCYHPGLSVTASCRICLAEVAVPHPKTGELVKMPKLVPTCQQPAVDGAEVYLDSDMTIANQKAVMEYLLINHPLDCPVCDQAGECCLQDYSYRFGRALSRFEDEKVKKPKKDIGPNVLLYSDRCIMCTRCVRFCNEITGTDELSVQGRGRFEQIGIFPGKPLDNELSGNVVDLCPVGALVDKQFLFAQRVWFLTETPSIDPITASGDNIWIHHNKGRIWRVKPRENSDINRWWTSDEIRYSWKFVHDENRLFEPTISGKESDWNAALRAVVDGLKGKKIALLASPMISCEDAHLLGKFVRNIDSNAVVGLGPVPMVGQDKTFPGGYTVYGEKAPNARGVRRVLGDSVADFDNWINQLTNVDAVVLTGNYPTDWATGELINALRDKFIVLMDVLPGSLTQIANVVLPAATWAEKSGTFENVNHLLQPFEQAIDPIGLVRAEAQIALDLIAASGAATDSRYDAAAVRKDIGGELVDIHITCDKPTRCSDMRYIEI